MSMSENNILPSINQNDTKLKRIITLRKRDHNPPSLDSNNTVLVDSSKSVGKSIRIRKSIRVTNNIPSVTNIIVPKNLSDETTDEEMIQFARDHPELFKVEGTPFESIIRSLACKPGCDCRARKN